MTDQTAAKLKQTCEKNGVRTRTACLDELSGYRPCSPAELLAALEDKIAQDPAAVVLWGEALIGQIGSICEVPFVPGGTMVAALVMPKERRALAAIEAAERMPKCKR